MRLKLLMFFFILTGFRVFAQAPNISYNTPQVYTPNVLITPLVPTNTGGAVPAAVYGQVSTFAGSGTQGAVNGTGTAASFKFPVSVATDAAGNVYVGDAGNNLIRKITPTGLVSTFAGSGAIGATNGPAASASFWEPDGLVVDAANNVYVADGSNSLIRKITPAGVVSTFAGNSVSGAVNGTGTAASFANPWGITIDATGNLYVVDNGNNMIRKITPAAVVTTFAGNGIPGSLNGVGTAATFNYPNGLTIDGSGNLYVTDSQNNLIRKINIAASVSTFVDGAVSGGIARPYAATADAIGNIYIGDYASNKILKVSPAGVLSNFAGSGVFGSTNGTTTAASFNHPIGLAMDGLGNLYVADQLSNQIRKVSTTGYIISPALPAGLVFDSTTGTISGTPTALSPATTYTISAYNLSGVSTATVSIAVAAATPTITSFNPSTSAPGSVITIAGTNLLSVTGVSIGGVPASSYTIVSSTTITALVAPGATSGSVSLTSPSGTISSTGFILLTAPNISYITPQTYSTGIAITPLLPSNTGGAVPATIYGQVITFAGSGAAGANNGTGAAATFDHPYGLTLDGTGNLYIADCFNHEIRKITSTASVSTLAGNGFPGAGNFAGATASFNFPGGVTVDGSGNIFVGDQTNNLIRKIAPSGLVSTYAGSGALGYSDGTAASATFNSPAGLTMDASGNLFVADRQNNVIRKITPGGIVSTFAGSGSTGAINGTGTAAMFNGCSGIATDILGNFYVADQFNNMIRKITPAGLVSTIAGNVNAGKVNGTGTAASFYQPFGLTVDAQGNIYVADEFNNLIRKITPAGVVTTLAGSGTAGSNNGIGPLANFNYPSGVALDGNGNLFVAETVGDVIRKIVLTGYTIDKPLPTGLTFDPTTGQISGTPTVTSPATVYTITAYNAAGSSSTTLSITVSTPQTVSYPGNATTITKNYGDADFPPGATATSGLPVTYTSSNTSIATITSGGTIHIVGAGVTTITAMQTGNTTYQPATPVTLTLTVLPCR